MKHQTELNRSVTRPDLTFYKICSAALSVFMTHPAAKINAKLEICSLVCNLTQKSGGFAKPITDLIVSEEAAGFNMETLISTVVNILGKKV